MVCKNLRALLFVVMLSVVTVFAATTGKIRGKVVDGATGEPIPGATIMVEGTQLGASTMGNGEYFILQVPPGIQKVKCLIVGYATLTQENIIISSDTTTTVDFKMSTKIAGQEDIIVQAKKPIVQKDNTSSQKTFDSTQISKLTNATMSGVLESQAGVSSDAAGNLHVRGGRDNEVAYIIDGIMVNNSFTGDNSFNLESDSIEEMKVVTGGFNAEYGGAMSGIVRVVTKSGQKEFHGKVSYKTTKLMIDEMLDYYGQQNMSAYVSGPIPNPFIKDISFQLSFNQKTDNGLMLYHPKAMFLVNKGNSLTGFTTSEDYIAWVNDARAGNTNFDFPVDTGYEPYYRGYYPDEYNREWKYYGALSVRPLKTLRVGLSVNKSVEHSFNNYNNSPSLSYRYRYLNAADTVVYADLYTLSLTHTINSSMYYDANFSVQYNAQLTATNGMHYTDFEGWGEDAVYTSNVKMGYISIANTYSYRQYTNLPGGVDPHFYNYRDEALKAAASLTWQIDRINQLKVGGEYMKDNVYLEGYSARRSEMSYADKYEVEPYKINAFVQDKIEVEDMIINVGLRLEHFNSNVSYYEDPGQAVQLHSAIQANGNPLIGAWTTEGMITSETKTYVLPRVGISYPLSDTGVFRFSYGHFYQYPTYQEMYSHIHGPISQDYYGNPNLDAQKSVQYEAGFEQGLTDIMAISVTGYYKDSTDVLSLVTKRYSDVMFYQYVNKDFSRSMGMDFVLSKRFSEHYSFDISYGFMMVKGSASSADENLGRLVDTQYIAPVRTEYLSYDRRHNVAVNVAFGYGKGQGFDIYGVKPLENVDFSMSFKAASGLPYTRTNDAGNELGEKNTSHMPWTKVVDLRFSKGFNVYRNVKAKLVVEAENVFNWANLYSINTATGKARVSVVDINDFNPTLPQDMLQYNMCRENYNDLDAYGIPRIIRMGVEVSF